MSDKPSATGRFLAAGGLALGGLALAAFLVVLAFTGGGEPVRFVAPGEASLEAREPGTWVIWHEHRTTFAGRSFDVPPQPPSGMRYAVTGPSGKALAVRSTSRATWRSNGDERLAVAEFEVLEPGPHAVRFEGATAERVFAVQPSQWRRVLALLGGAFAAAVVGVGAGFALALHTFLGTSAGAPAGPAAGAQEEKLRQLAAVVYGLQAGALLVGVTLFAGVVVNYLKRGEAAGTWLESHFTWQIRTFWWSLGWSIAGLATVMIGVGLLVLVAATIWFVYRLAKGWTRLNDGKPMYTP